VLGERGPWDGADGAMGCQVGGAGGRRARSRHVAGALYLSRCVDFCREELSMIYWKCIPVNRFGNLVSMFSDLIGID
jgi:hypothetical protein